MKTAAPRKPSKTFEDLVVWQKSRELNLYIYRLTKKYPAEERYGLVPQMRRAAISVSSNIAEGFARYQSKDKEHFYVIAAGSLDELLSQMVVSNDLGYISQNELDGAREILVVTRRHLLALLKAHRS